MGHGYDGSHGSWVNMVDPLSTLVPLQTSLLFIVHKYLR